MVLSSRKSRAAPVATSSQTTLSDMLKLEDDSNVLLTPRRGRRLGGVDMGWGSPIDRDTARFPSCPHTLPKASRTKPPFTTNNDLDSTPTKRKASAGFAKNPRAPQKTLVDNKGWASAAMLSAVPLASSHVSPDFSSQQTIPTTPRSASPRLFADSKDAFASFSTAPSPILPTTPRLVPLEVEGLGRVAVHRELASQISEQGPYDTRTSLKRHSSFSSDRTSDLMRGAESEASSVGSSLGSSTNPTSVGTPCPSGPSPSFSLSSEFPPSEPSSPLKRAPVDPTTPGKPPRGSEKLSPSAQAALREIIHRSPGSKLASSDLLDNACWRPRLGGSQAVTKAALPSLDWPDCPAGPWAAAGEHVDNLKQQRKEGIQKWLETELDEESAQGAEASSSSYQHHPMVAKVLLDRVRKQNLEVLMAASNASHSSPSPRKRSRKTGKAQSLFTTPARRGRKPKKMGSDTPSRCSVATGASLARSEISVIVGCKCGINDNSIIMVQCDHCHRWLHLPCVGISHADELDDEWFCDDCCTMIAHEHLSPASSLPTTISSLADLSTPEGIQAALSSMCEPVFALPSGTPMHQRSVALSHSIALAPSPPMLSIGQHPEPRSSIKRQGVGRSRAERVGWRLNEPGSPLARKSTTASGVSRPRIPETPSKSSDAHYDLAEATSTPSLLAGFSRADWEPVHARAGERYTTPSPRLGNMSTPSRHTSSRRPSHGGGALSFGLIDDDAHHADVFSTPSRLTSGGSWGYHAHPGSQTPSRSGGRHQRIDSFTGAFSTPGREFLGGAFSTEHSTVQSGGMPSLVYSSGGMDAVDDHFMDGGYHLARAWQMQSPTSTTRAVRARQISGYGTPPSSTLLRTPELQPRQATSSLRGNRMDTDDPPTSSSPFPRTPTFDVDSPRFSGADRGHLGLGLPTSSSAGRPGKHASTTAAKRNSSIAKNRQVSSEMPLGLGIGFDLDDVLDWS